MAADLAPTAVSRNYYGWNSILVDTLFPSGRAGVPVYLAVHEALLDECGERHSLGRHDAFVEAVVGLADAEGLFVVLDRLAKAWDKDGRSGIPPFVAGLALAVLAAGDMTTDESATQANYYFRLNKLLGVQSREGPKWFDRTPKWWSLLREWLTADRRGELVVRGLNGPRRFVDPVKSQCLVRSCDIQDFLPVLRAADVRPSQIPEPEDLLASLRGWLSGAGAGSRLSLLLGRDPETAALYQAAEALCDAIEDCPADEPLVVGAEARRVQPHGSLAVMPNRYPNLMWKRASWIVQLRADTEAEERECLALVGDRVVIARLDVREPATYDVPITPAEAAGLLSGRIRVTDEDGTDTTPKAVPLAWFEDASLRGRPGLWTTVDTPAAGDEHAVVFLDTDAYKQIQPFLDRPGVRMAGSEHDWPGSGLSAATGVVARAGARVSGNVVVQARQPFLRLQGGLAIRRRVYLRGALPTVVAAEATALRVRHRELKTAPHSMRAGDFPKLDLPEGPHVVTCGGATTEVFVVEPRWRECIAPVRAESDHEVRVALEYATLRGALPTVDRAIYTSYFAPGTSYRVYSGRMLKGVAPVDGGIHEVRSEEPQHQTIVMKRIPASPPVPLADCFRSMSAVGISVDADNQYEAANRLLEYVSARGAGSVDATKVYCATLAGEGTWHSALSTLEDLGHMDLAWERRRWAVAPPLACARAVDDRTAVLTGVRARQTVAWLRERGIAATTDERAIDSRRNVMPACIIVPVNDIQNSSQALQELGMRFLPASPAPVMARQIKPVSEMAWWLGPAFSPSQRIRRILKRWDVAQLQWRGQGERGKLDGPALYQWREHGVVVHYLVNGDIRARVRDPAAAKWFLAPNDRAFLAYDAAKQRLLVPLAIGLPRIWRRICTIASGLAPTREERLLVYEGIPIDLARAVAIRLNQTREKGLL